MCRGKPLHARVDNDLSSSPEAQHDVQSMIRMYQTCFNRAPDRAGLSRWIKALRRGNLSLIEIAQRFVTSKEFKNLYGANPTPDTFVTVLCQNAFGRAPDAADYQGWINYLTVNRNSKGAKGATLIAISNSMAFVYSSIKAP